MAVLSKSVLESVVKNYKESNRPRNKAEFSWYAAQPSLEAAVRAAALGTSSDGKRGRQARRGTDEAFKLAEEKLVLLLDAMQSAKTFDALLEFVERAVLPIPGLNDVYAYETAMRIGAYLNIWPKHVYLYTSTRSGAKQLGIVSKKRLLLFNSLPEAFQELEPYEVEEALSNLKKLNTEPAAPVSYFGKGIE
ncbi:hypothetical protein KJZ99_07080 [bacterium]|nr:hypothetical protein [bacterium]